MDMFNEMPEVQGVILCASSAYEEKYYFNQEFANVPPSIQDELKILCVLYTADIGGILVLHFDEKGNLLMHVTADSLFHQNATARENDLLFDEIGSVLKIKQIQADKRELLEALEMYYRAIFLHEDISELLED